MINWKFIGFFIVGLLIFGLIQIVIYFPILISLFDIFPCGNDYLDDRRADLTVFIVLTAMAIIQAFICIRFIRKKTYYEAGYAGLMTNLFTLYFVFLIGPHSLNFDNYYKEFSQEEWIENPDRPFKMVCYVINYNLIEGKTKSEVIELLGPPDHSSDDNTEIYYLNSNGYEPLVTAFSKDEIISYYLECND